MLFWLRRKRKRSRGAEAHGKARNCKGGGNNRVSRGSEVDPKPRIYEGAGKGGLTVSTGESAGKKGGDGTSHAGRRTREGISVLGGGKRPSPTERGK